jgi:hypothetical protein
MQCSSGDRLLGLRRGSLGGGERRVVAEAVGVGGREGLGERFRVHHLQPDPPDRQVRRQPPREVR